MENIYWESRIYLEILQLREIPTPIPFRMIKDNMVVFLWLSVQGRMVNSLIFPVQTEVPGRREKIEGKIQFFSKNIGPFSLARPLVSYIYHILSYMYD